MLTEQQIRDYVERGGSGCPWCGPDVMIEADHAPDVDGPECTQRIACPQCERAWWDCYKLYTIQEDED